MLSAHSLIRGVGDHGVEGALTECVEIDCTDKLRRVHMRPSKGNELGCMGRPCSLNQSAPLMAEAVRRSCCRCCWDEANYCKGCRNMCVLLTGWHCPGCMEGLWPPAPAHAHRPRCSRPASWLGSIGTSTTGKVVDEVSEWIRQSNLHEGVRL